MDPIERGTDGAKYYKADLHVHTPGSYDYPSDVSCEDLVDRFVEEGLDIVATTDHDCAGKYEEIRELAADRSVTVLPGVEITTAQGGENQVHVLAIFSPEDRDMVNHVLSQAGINPGRAGEQQADERIKKICERVLQNGGLPILAHIDEPAGAHEETDGRNHEEIFDPECVTAIEVVDEDIRGEYPEFPAIRSSDAHHPDELGRGYCYLKMTEPTFAGLRTALSDPDLRISLDEPRNDHPYIEGLRVEGGFLDGREVQLNSSLNCLIGGKGTGKSTLIEHIRYAFDIDPRTPAIEAEYEELIEATLGPDGTVEVHIADAEQRYVVRREFGEDPEIVRISDDGSEKPVDVDILTFREDFFDLEIHSQRELLQLARDDRTQLDLIDSYVNVSDAKSRREEIKNSLRENAQSLRSARNRLENLESELNDLGAVQENIAILEEEGVDEYLEDEEDWETERRRLDHYADTLEGATDEIEELTVFEDSPVDDVEELPNSDLVEEARSIVESAFDEAEELRREIVQRLEEADEALNEPTEEWDERYGERKEHFESLSEEIEEEIGVDIDEYFDLKGKEARLEGVQDEVQEKQEEIARLEKRREELLEQLERVRREITQTRREGIGNIDEHLSEDVRVRLETDANREEYTEWFSDVLKGSRVRSQDKEAIAAQYDPDALATLVRNEEVEQLSEALNLTETAAENVVRHEDLRDRIHELEIQEIHDQPVIELRDEGDWKPLSQMSDGQQCTALLSIAMLERDRPLIVDQPEDMLDNEFIYDVVVALLQNVKESRQIISATHNANIPVLGDAEQILVMRCDGQQGYVTKRGSIDDEEVQKKAQQILEGGQEAFDRRTRKYGILERP